VATTQTRSSYTSPLPGHGDWLSGHMANSTLRRDRVGVAVHSPSSELEANTAEGRIEPVGSSTAATWSGFRPTKPWQLLSSDLNDFSLYTWKQAS
jgi:hypothetical protein